MKRFESISFLQIAT